MVILSGAVRLAEAVALAETLGTTAKAENKVTYFRFYATRE